MRFIVVGDVHIADVAPSTRKDDYKNVVLGKLQFIVNYVNAEFAAKNDIKAVLICGDLFHKKIPFHNSHSMISSLISIFEQCQVPIYIVPGNHDIHGNMSTFGSQPLNVLIQSGVMSLLNNAEPVVFTDGDVTCSVNGVDFSPLLDNKNAADLYQLKHADADVKISMYHQMILPDDKKFFDNYINFEDLSDNNADVLICGHYHEGYFPSLRNEHGKFFLNCGSITRGTAEQANFDKEPKFEDLSIYRNESGELVICGQDVLIPFIAAKEVFDFNVIERNRKKKDMHEFMDGLSEMESQSLSTQEPSGILNALKLLGLESRLEQKALGYLEDAYEGLT